MDETPVWFEQVSNTTIDTRGGKEILIKSTGHNKVRLTVVLTACSDETKLEAYVIIPRKRAIKDVEQISDVICRYNTKSWMHDSLATDYLLRVILILKATCVEFV